MRIIERQGDLFDAPERAIGHGVNCGGVMGAGIAAEFRRCWPEMFWEYQDRCAKGCLRPGGVFDWEDPLTDQVILNLATQSVPGPSAQLYWISGAIGVASHTLQYVYDLNELAIPRIGCGIGGLDWASVKRAIEETRPRSHFTVVVYTPEEKYR